MDNFPQCVVQVLQDEGGIVNNVRDPGGITKYGISLRFLQENNINPNKDNVINAKDVSDLTIDEAKQIYREYFWDKYNISLISDLEIAEKVFNLGVNMGSMKSIELLQEAINFHSSNYIVVDGIIGPATVNAINSINSDVLLDDYKMIAVRYYSNLVAKNPALVVFLKGWINRAEE